MTSKSFFVTKQKTFTFKSVKMSVVEFVLNSFNVTKLCGSNSHFNLTLWHIRTGIKCAKISSIKQHKIITVSNFQFWQNSHSAVNKVFGDKKKYVKMSLVEFVLSCFSVIKLCGSKSHFKIGIMAHSNGHKMCQNIQHKTAQNFNCF